MRDDLPAKFDDIVRKALQRGPEKRYQSATEMSQEILSLLAVKKRTEQVKAEEKKPRIVVPAEPKEVVKSRVLPEGLVPITKGIDAESGLPMQVRREKDGAQMVLVPAGAFTMGSNDYKNEKPQHEVYLDAYYIDKYSVTNAQYKAFVEATGNCEPEGYNWNASKSDFKPWQDSDWNGPKRPVVCVSWEDAVAYTEWAGARLLTEPEWEKAARGTDARKYP